MSFADLLIQTCIIKRHSVLSYDDYGNPILGWTDYLPNVACRLASSGGREIKRDIEVVIADYKLYLGDVDITELDVVLLELHHYAVLLVEPFRNANAIHHKRAYLQIVRDLHGDYAKWPATGTEFPPDAREGEIFYRTDLDALYVYKVT